MTALDFLLYTIAFVISIVPAAIALVIGLSIIGLVIFFIFVGIQTAIESWKNRK